MDSPPVASHTSATATVIESPETIILQWHSNAGHNVKFGRGRFETQHLLDAFDQLQRSMDSPAISASTVLARRVAMARMEDEFRSILVSISPVKHRLHSDPSSTYTDSELSLYSINSEVIPDEAIHNIHSIAERMVAAGKSRECIDAYASVRKTGLEKELRNLEIEKLSTKNIKRLEWELLKEKIGLCLHTVNICVRLLFAGERTLTKQIFNGLGTNIADDCFMKTVKDSAIKLFNFVEAISTSRKSPEKLFKILDLYDVFSGLMLDIETIFGFQSGEFIRKHAVEILSRLAETAREILSEFEKAVFGEISKASVSGGSVHPLTKYVMNYMNSIVEYKKILIQLIVSKPSMHSSNLQDIDCSDFETQDSLLVLHLVCITTNLKFNLKAKSKQFKDGPLAHFFMMNNVHYIVGKIKGSIELREMIGDDYVNKLTGDYNLAASNYLKTSWKRVLDCLRHDGLQKLGSFLCGILSDFVPRRRIKAFNAKFKEALMATQATWLVVDVQLREDLSFSILEMLIPVYTSFLERHRSHIESGKHTENYIKYSVEDVLKEVMTLCEAY